MDAIESDNITTSSSMLDSNMTDFLLREWYSKRDIRVGIIYNLDLHLVPAICVAGILGNALSFVVFTCTYLRRTSASIYLAALSVADACFLLAALVKWTDKTFMKLYTRDGWCQTIVFIKYVSTFLSVWYVVSFTSERYIAVHFPLKRNHLCTARRAKMVVIILAVGAMMFYGAVFWFYGRQDIHHLHICAPYDQYTDLVTTYLHNFNTVIMLIIPFCLITVMNVRIALKVLKFYKRQETMRRANWGGSVTRQTSLFRARSESPSGTPRCTAADGAQPSRSTNDTCDDGARRRSQYHNKTQERVTKLLLIVSTVFLVMNLPRHIARTYGFISKLTDEDYQPSWESIFWGSIFKYFYYMNFALNLFLYSVCGHSFRRAAGWLRIKITHMISEWCARICSKQDDVQRYDIQSTRSHICMANLGQGGNRTNRTSLNI